MPNAEREKLETLLNGNEAELEGQTVTLDAVSLKALFDAHQDVRQVYAKAARRDELRRERAAKADGEDPQADNDDEQNGGEA